MLKILLARNQNRDFEFSLSEIITGSNNKFPFNKDLLSIKTFFYNLGYIDILTEEPEPNFNLTLYVSRTLNCFDIKNIYKVVSEGIFRKNIYENNDAIKIAEQDFANFINYSISNNKSFDLTRALDINLNNELLFNIKTKTQDERLNTLVNKAREYYIDGKIQDALEQIWDAFEALKTFYGAVKQEGKKISADKLLDKISINFEKDKFNEEFKFLKDLGDKYYIRHKSTHQQELSDKHKEYFFFRMLSLINLCLKSIN